MKKLKDESKTAMILITHDLGIVAEICDEVAIMYAGEIVEYGSLENIFNDAKHPYTKGLFACIPDIYADENELTPIPGLMPDLSNVPEGCNFCPRCTYALPICKTNASPVYEVSPGHFVTCVLFEDKDKLGGDTNVQ